MSGLVWPYTPVLKLGAVEEEEPVRSQTLEAEPWKKKKKCEFYGVAGTTGRGQRATAASALGCSGYSRLPWLGKGGGARGGERGFPHRVGERTGIQLELDVTNGKELLLSECDVWDKQKIISLRKKKRIHREQREKGGYFYIGVSFAVTLASHFSTVFHDCVEGPHSKALDSFGLLM
jgi:hypothetical protein